MHRNLFSRLPLQSALTPRPASEQEQALDVTSSAKADHVPRVRTWPNDDFHSLWPVRTPSKSSARKRRVSKELLLEETKVSSVNSFFGAETPRSLDQDLTNRSAVRRSSKSRRNSLSLSARLSVSAGANLEEGNCGISGEPAAVWANSATTPMEQWLWQTANRKQARNDILQQRSAESRLKAQKEAEKTVSRRASHAIRQVSSLPCGLPGAGFGDGSAAAVSQLMSSKLLNQTSASGGEWHESSPSVSTEAPSSSSFSPSSPSEFMVRRGSGSTYRSRPLTMDDKRFWSKGTMNESRRGSKEAPSVTSPAVTPSGSRRNSIIDEKKDAQINLTLRLSSKHKISLDTVQAVREEFDEYDIDGDDNLTIAEFTQKLRDRLEIAPEQALPQDLLGANWAHADKDRNGSLNFEEFLLWSHSRTFSEDLHIQKVEKKLRDLARGYNVTIPEVEAIKSKFDYFDLDKSGEIDKDEFKKLLMMLLNCKDPSDLPDRRLDRYWAEIDSDHSGAVSLEEFIFWYLKYFHTNSQHDMDGAGCGAISQAYSSLGVNRFHSLGH